MLLTGYSGQAYLGMGDAYLFTSDRRGRASAARRSSAAAATISARSPARMVLTILTGLLPALNLSSGALLVVYGARHPDHRFDRQRGVRRPRRRAAEDPRARAEEL